MATFNKFQNFIERLGKGEFDLNGDTFKFFLSNEQPLATDDVKSDIAEITNENGYAAPVDIENAFTESSGTGTMTAVDKTVTASGGTIGPFQFIVVYDDDHASDALMGWIELASAVTLKTGQSLNVNFGASLMTIS